MKIIAKNTQSSVNRIVWKWKLDIRNELIANGHTKAEIIILMSNCKNSNLSDAERYAMETFMKNCEKILKYRETSGGQIFKAQN